MKLNWKLSIVLALIIGISAGCSSTEKKEVEETATNVVYSYPEDTPQILQDCIDNYGGIQAWRQAKTLEYDLIKSNKKEHQLIDLNTRKVRLSAEKYKMDTVNGEPVQTVSGNYELGFDGEQVWVAPNKAAYGTSSARFYHNLYFYFFTFPYIVTDPGINYQDFGLQLVDSVEYHKVGIGYGDNVGDSPEDTYNLFIDPQSKELKFITYTVTYFSGEPSDRYNALVYSDWTKAGDLQFAQTLTSYRWEGDKLGNQRGLSKFENISISEKAPDASLFTMPAVAEIDSLKKD